MLFSFSEACPREIARVCSAATAKIIRSILASLGLKTPAYIAARVNKALTARCDAARVRTGNFVRRKSSLFTKMMPMVTE